MNRGNGPGSGYALRRPGSGAAGPHPPRRRDSRAPARSCRRRRITWEWGTSYASPPLPSSCRLCCRSVYPSSPGKTGLTGPISSLPCTGGRERGSEAGEEASHVILARRPSVGGGTARASTHRSGLSWACLRPLTFNDFQGCRRGEGREEQPQGGSAHGGGRNFKRRRRPAAGCGRNRRQH